LAEISGQKVLEGRDDTDFPAVGLMNKVLVAGNDYRLADLEKCRPSGASFTIESGTTSN
jgi:hypothetical protein